MTAISDCFETLGRNRECALIPFITAGDPDLATTAAALQTLDRHGADIIELGVPYSDPLADGPVIQAAATRALQRGTKLEQVLEMLQTTTPSLRSPIILFTYYNPILHRGIEKFLQQIAAAGVAGLVVPDLPLEEAAGLLQPASEIGIDLTLLVAPTSSAERIEAIAVPPKDLFIWSVSLVSPGCDRKWNHEYQIYSNKFVVLLINRSAWALGSRKLHKPSKLKHGEQMR